MSRRDEAPRSLLAPPDDVATLFTQESTLALAQQVRGYMTAEDSTIEVESGVSGYTEFSLNEVQGGYDSASRSVSFSEEFAKGKRNASMSIDTLDDASLKAAVAKAEALAQAETVLGREPEPRDPLRAAGSVNPALWSDKSATLLTADARLAAAQGVLSATDKLGLVAAGHLRADPSTIGVLTKAGHFEFGRSSTCRYTVTARTKDGTGSGWAAWVGEDWSKANPEAIVARAVDLAQRTRNPVAVEPGRWTVVMTPEACGELVFQIPTAFLGAVLSGPAADHGDTPFSKPGGGNKIGLKVLDERVTLSIDPMDPEGGFIPFGYGGRLVQFVPVKWVENGVLKALSYPTVAQAAQHGIDQVNNPMALRMSGGPTSIEEMIATTERGIYVTRFSDVTAIQLKTLYMTGVTRDGTFLIEKGKITKPIKNLRFEDSPFFFLNNLAAIGPARRVAVGYRPYVMPAIKVRDFAFTSLTDAV
jgi:predicted Zn-dependent protease